ncbi:LacI family DNA-binding transcriptional regulator [Paenibacillus spongiae]|uniref:LacI family DNA-binding transcriptional regulator n=1 Tax=Paenibacillus spongiae TaxID=2909671 RepID=A0ABY5S8K2_9BACL|nr:LacI family DNA-binding transcriptional regulator [Paenibacillus spongiae]UVI30234.1 LacI family DNA-binding transcriptional regulator [Paenibacillus spongiae]
MGRKVTMQEIADLAGVSKFAVSRALSGKPGVSEKTREMIQKAAGQLGYFKSTPKSRNEELRDTDSGQWSGTIVVLFPNIRFQNRDSLYWGPIFDGVSVRLNQKGLDILTLTEPTSDHVFSLLNPDAIHGIITVGTISRQILLDIKELHIPIVMVDHFDPTLHCDTILTDNFSCMQEMITKLISKGYKSFQFVGNVGYAQSFYERWIAFRATLEEFQLECKQRPELIDAEEDQVEQAIAAIPADELPEVFVCANDSNAKKVLGVLHNRGIALTQCAVTGFDNTHELIPTLATVDVNKELLGMRAVDIMLWRIANPQSSFEKTLVYADVILRDYNGNK